MMDRGTYYAQSELNESEMRALEERQKNLCSQIIYSQDPPPQRSPNIYDDFDDEPIELEESAFGLNDDYDYQEPQPEPINVARKSSRRRSRKRSFREMHDEERNRNNNHNRNTMQENYDIRGKRGNLDVVNDDAQFAHNVQFDEYQGLSFISIYLILFYSILSNIIK